MFEDKFKDFKYDLQKKIERELNKNKKAGGVPFDALAFIRPDIISEGLRFALQTGNWNIQRFNMNRPGITEILCRLSYISALGMMTRVTSNVLKTRKISGPRSLQPSQWGMLCPSDTPEGASCGLVKNLALTTHVTTDSPEEPLLKLAIDLGMEDVALMTGDELYSPKHVLIFVNGSPVGIHKQADKFVRNFRLLRKKGRIQEFVSIYKNETQNCIYIASDGGRLVRPLLVCNK